MIQFTAPISNGSSGGALLDMFGRLVGLITAGFDNGQNLNLAVPSQEIYQFAQNFIEAH
ncbi:S1C family serine protease [Peptococcaceae bacterium 1198_IL3148]